MPADGPTVAVWLASLFTAGMKPSTVAVKSAAVAFFHDRARAPDGGRHPNPCASPEVRDVLAGIRNLSADAGFIPHQASPVLVHDLRAALSAIDRGAARGRRDAAILLMGFATAMRRSELAALKVADVERHERGMIVRIRRSKGDQGGLGQAVGVPYGLDPWLCPAKALDAWLSDLRAAGLGDGHVFVEVHRSGTVLSGRDGKGLDPESINRIVKRRLSAAGAPTSAHGLRAGFATETLRRGTPLAKVQSHLRHADPRTTMAYYRDVDRLDAPPGEGLL